MAELKTSVHQMIDKIDDPAFLELIHDMLDFRLNHSEGVLWESLSESQKKTVLDRLPEVNDPSTHYSHEEVKKANKKWLK